jgi:hypothetical protein
MILLLMCVSDLALFSVKENRFVALTNGQVQKPTSRAAL